MLSLHLKWSFISLEKKATHDADILKILDEGFPTFEKYFPKLEVLAILILASELNSIYEVILSLSSKGIVA